MVIPSKVTLFTGATHLLPPYCGWQFCCQKPVDAAPVLTYRILNLRESGVLGPSRFGSPV